MKRLLRERLRDFEHWFHCYGSEVPDDLFKLARFASMSIQVIAQPAFALSPAMQRLTIADLKTFKEANRQWQRL